MMHKFNLEDHHQLNMMYKIRHKWSTAFTKDSFTAEFKASLRSKSTNHVLNNIVDTTISLTNFVIKLKVHWQICILQSLMKIFDASKAPYKEQLRRVVFWVMQLKSTHVRYPDYLNMNSLIALQQSGSKLIVKIQLMSLR